MKKMTLLSGMSFQALTRGSLLFNLLLVSLFSLHLGCQPLSNVGKEKGDRSNFRTDPHSPKLSVFFNLEDPDSPPIILKLKAIEALADDSWQPLNTTPLEIQTEEIKEKQAILLRTTVSEGLYQKFRIVFDEVLYLRDGKETPVSLQETTAVVSLKDSFSVSTADSQSIFFTLDVKASVSKPGIFQPVFSATSSQLHPLMTNLIFVTCPDIDTVYTARADKNKISGSFGVSGRPTYLAVDPVRDRLYVLTTKDSAIKIYEISSSRLIDTIRIPLVYNPNHMIISPDADYAYVLDSQSSSIVRVDLTSGVMSGRGRVPEQSEYMIYLSERNRIAVSSEMTQAISLLDPVSLNTVETISVGNSPQGLLVKDDRLYIAEGFSNTVGVLDLNSRSILVRLNVGFAPKRLAANESNIFVTNYGSGSLSILTQGQLSVRKEIPVGGSPHELAASPNLRWLYIGDEKSEKITVIDLTSERVVTTMDLATPPLDIALIH